MTARQCLIYRTTCAVWRPRRSRPQATMVISVWVTVKRMPNSSARKAPGSFPRSLTIAKQATGTRRTTRLSWRRWWLASKTQRSVREGFSRRVRRLSSLSAKRKACHHLTGLTAWSGCYLGWQTATSTGHSWQTRLSTWMLYSTHSIPFRRICRLISSWGRY